LYSQYCGALGLVWFTLVIGLQTYFKENSMLEKIQTWIYSQGWRFWIGVDFALWAVLIIVGMWFFF
jgi:hypothetical protein